MIDNEYLDVVRDVYQQNKIYIWIAATIVVGFLILVL